MSAPASVSATLSASSAAGGAMSAERAMSNSSAPVKALKSDEIKECFVLVNSINTPIGKPMILTQKLDANVVVMH